MAQLINSAATPTNGAPVMYDLIKVQEACSFAASKATLEMLKTFQAQGKDQTHKALAESVITRLDPLLQRKNTDEKVQKVYSLLFHATMENVENGIMENFLSKLATATAKQKIEQARVKPNLELVKVAGDELLKKFVAVHVIPEAIALAEKLQKENPNSFTVNGLWNVATDHVEKYKAYNIG